ncbi:SoxR reducing system RseC family protein [Aestuariibacter halophilus]|uniref:SoxR reducing system RseC family protein n=1 Tax=Fluctibacter halophilus TaxID=226011 RepID=A0ABS8G4C1_9ALTE|nr:SoxR reducing system RseC family protein [Aestuariibacter halophilus]MCC2614700.1 SoxR reducing system RseC family protein [Aestuariibacter halophilus]
MIEEIGQISRVDNDHIWVETEIKTTCGSCEAQSSCGTGAVAKAFAPKKDTLILRCREPAEVGQKVKLGIPEQQLVKASALMYLIPLAVLIATALTGQWLMTSMGIENELWLVGACLLTGLASFVTLRRMFEKPGEDAYHPRLLAILPSDGSSIPIRHLPDGPG